MAVTGPSGAPGCRRSVRTISNHDPTITATPAYTSTMPKNVPFFDPEAASTPKNHAPGDFSTKGETACATPSNTQTPPTNPATPGSVSEQGRTGGRGAERRPVTACPITSSTEAGRPPPCRLSGAPRLAPGPK